MKILATSDWHLSAVRPLCRTDNDWIGTQAKHIKYVFDKCLEDIENTIVVVAGDVFDTPTVAPILTNLVLSFADRLRGSVFIAGNHDLKLHATSRMNECSFGAIRAIRCKKDFTFDYGEIQPSDEQYEYVAVHTYTVANEQDKLPSKEQYTAEDLCSMFPNTPIIIVGDNHTPWHKRVGSQLVVNCGTLIQRTAAEAKRHCGFYMIDTDTLQVEYIDLQEMSEGCIDTTYIENIKEKEENRQAYEALVSEIKDGVDNKYDFTATLSSFIETHRADIAEGVYNILVGTLTYIRGGKQ